MTGLEHGIREHSCEQREIPLSRGLVGLVDAQDYDAVIAFKWYAHNAGHGKLYVARTTNHPRRHFLLHRELMDAPADLVVDHINGNGLDNRRSNLRLCTKSENGFNRGATRASRSGVKGVQWNPRANCWRAFVTERGRSRFLGHFDRIEDAAAAYAKAATRVAGEFATSAQVPT